MTKALEEEIAKLEQETQTTEEDVSDAVREEEAEEVKEPAKAEEETVVAEETDEDKQAKLEAYKKRIQERKAKQEADIAPSRQEQIRQEAQDVVDEQAELRKLVEEMRQFKQQQQFQANLMQAEKELQAYEKEFKEVYSDYDEKVSRAIEFSKLRLMADGMPEAQAEELLRREKVLLADKAAAMGEDPVQAVYDEANKILGWLDMYAEKAGYVKPSKPKTNLQALREASKPNAMSSGTGRGAAAVTRTFDDLGDDDLEEIHNTTIWDVK